jgi:hypothetical protein
MFDTNDPEELKKQIVELKAQLKRISHERDLYKETVNSFLRTQPFDPPTAKEIEDMMNGPRGEPISKIIVELEREFSISDDLGQFIECER